MYEMYIPVAIDNPRFDAERVAEDIEYAGAKGVFIALGEFDLNEEKFAESLERTKKALDFFKKKGFFAGIWYWSFCVIGADEFTPIKGLGGKTSANWRCPSDRGFLRFYAERTRAVAKLNPDMILLDDDLRFGFHDCGQGCVCENHMKRISELCGESVIADGFLKKAFIGGPNKYRSAFIKANGESVREYARTLRNAVNEVNPAVRIGMCSCLSNWDLDGSDAFEIASILAGDTKPFVRLIGAPYWAAMHNWGSCIADVIELARMEASWNTRPDIEVVSEGDCYPRPRWRVPASYVEMFDTALRFSGATDGILKYMIEYNSSADCERGYLDFHAADEGVFALLGGMTAGRCLGVRNWEFPAKTETAVLSEAEADEGRLQKMFFSHSARMLTQLGVPVTYEGNGCAGIVFGENARLLPAEALEHPLIMDLKAARILGLDGVAEYCGTFKPEQERFDSENEYVRFYGQNLEVMKVELGGRAVPDSWYLGRDGETPACWKVDGRYIVLNMDAYACGPELWRSYPAQRQLLRLLEGIGCILPAYTAGNPDIYIIARETPGGISLAVFNCSDDAAYRLRVHTHKYMHGCSFVNCEGELKDGEPVINKLAAHEFAIINCHSVK